MKREEWSRAQEARFGGGGLYHAHREAARLARLQDGSDSIFAPNTPPIPISQEPRDHSAFHRRISQVKECVVGDCEGLHVLPPDKAGNMQFMLSPNLINQWLDPNPGDVFNAMMNYLAHNGIVPRDDAFLQCKDAFFTANAPYIISPSEFTHPDYKQPEVLQNVLFILPKICRKPQQYKQGQVIPGKRDRVPTPSLPPAAEGSVPSSVSSMVTVVSPSHKEIASIAAEQRKNNAIISSELVLGTIAVLVAIRYFVRRAFAPQYPHQSHPVAPSSPSRGSEHRASVNHSAPDPDVEIKSPQPTPRPIDGGQLARDKATAVFAGVRMPGVQVTGITGDSRQATVEVKILHPESTARELQDLHENLGSRAQQSVQSALQHALGTGSVGIKVVTPKNK